MDQGDSNSETLVSIADRLIPERPDASKDNAYYAYYEAFFAAFRHRKPTVFEIGVFEGHSTKVLASYFPGGHIIGIDVEIRAIDFSAFPNVILRKGDQSDVTFLSALADELAPSGIDIVIDDASHMGRPSLKTFEALYPRLSRDGLYVVEDWLTGYWSHWPDGQTYRAQLENQPDNRIASHDFGMVGFVKHLVDQIGLAGEGAFGPSIHIFAPTVIIQRNSKPTWAARFFSTSDSAQGA
jgi:hypothetical protein